MRRGTIKMDVTIQTVLRLFEQGIPRRTIAKRAGISLPVPGQMKHQKKSGRCVRAVCLFRKLQKKWAWKPIPFGAICHIARACTIRNTRPLTPFGSEIRSEKQKKKPSPARIPHRMRAVALAEGFEPSDSFPSSVFWTDSINHSDKQADGAEGEIRTHMPRFPRRRLSEPLPYR